MSFTIPAGAAGLIGLFQKGASYENRIREAAYTPPSGTRITFLYEGVARETTKRTAAFEFPGVNGAYIQDNGYGSRRYPMVCIFSGKDHDLIATAFEAALLEKGVGKLEHPLYGTFNVVAMGDITRRNDLVAESNQSVIEVTFWTTVGAIYPSASSDPGDEISAALDGFDVAAAQQFAISSDLSTTLAKANLKSTIRKFLKEVQGALQSASDSVESVNREFRDITSLINQGLDTFIGEPLQLAQQVANLIKAPGRALTGIEQRLASYEDLASRIFSSPAGKPGVALTSGLALALRTGRIANDFHASDLFAMNAVSGSVVSVTNNAFTTKPQALIAAERVQAQFDAAVSWRDDGFAQIGTIAHPNSAAVQVDTGEAYQALHNAVALTTGFLIQVSFQLVPERAVVLDRPRTIVDLAAELYGDTPDAWLDLLINSNNLTGSEILELPRLKRIVYYPPPAA